MKLILDFLPILMFFAVFKYGEGHSEWAAAFASQHLGFMVSGGVVGPKEAPVLLATVVVVVSTLAQVAWLLARRQKVHMMLWVSLALVTVLGAATVWFHSDTFIKWKPTGLYWVMGLAFWASQTFFRKNLVQSLMGTQFDLPAAVWQRLNIAWVAFFGLMGLLNLYVAYSFETTTWVNFKLFGITGLMLVFMVGQGLYLGKHLKDDSTPDPDVRKDVA